MQDAHSDVVIAGGGAVGLSLAVALKAGAPGLSVTLVDIAPSGSPPRDERASAISAAARKMFEALGVWGEVASAAQPILAMDITDSRGQDRVRPVLLSFEPGEGTLGHMVPNGLLHGALQRAAAAKGVTLIGSSEVRDFAAGTGRTTVTLGDGRTLTASLLVAADGGRSRLRGLAGIPVLSWAYRQAAIVTTAEHEKDHRGRAVEHFLPSGPFAILPLSGKRSSLVWTEPEKEAPRLLALPEAEFTRELERRFGYRLGAVRPVGKRQSFPLSLLLARSFIAPRFALCGDAAHVIHPVAGQGLNLGLKDAAALAEAVVDAHRLGLDIGLPSVLARYESWRRFDTVRMAFVTDAFNRLFSNDNPLLRLARGIGLGVVDRLTGLKGLFAAEAGGTVGPAPRLLRGERI
ncbi:MAG: ubiquinone biosynthesis hydroxylase [Bauldia sp.]|nr:ubiquinone biosynthesis hydroxylase [Bauldia sp.]